MKDLKITKEGDLVLGQQATDRFGFLLYYEPEGGSSTRIRMTTVPSDISKPVRDIGMVYDDEGDLQLIASRLRTENPDWYHYTQVGADLSDLIGLPNNQDTAQLATSKIRYALTYDGAFSHEELNVTVAPVDIVTLFCDIQVQRSNRLFRYAGTFNLEMGSWNEFDMHALYQEGEAP